MAALPAIVKARPPSAAGTAGRQDVPLGTAAWMTFPEGRRPGFKKGDFWLSCLPDGKPVGFRDDRHVLVAGGTRTGKGASILIPNLLLWPGSAFVVDPKGENAMVTARRRGCGSPYCRGLGQEVHILDPFDAVRTDEDDFSDLKSGFNPLDFIRADRPESVDDAARIAEALIVSGDSQEPIWDESAKQMLKAIILHVGTSDDFAPDARHLVTVRRLLMAGDAEARHLALINGADGQAPSGMSFLFTAMQRNRAFGGVISDAGAMLGDMERMSPRTFTGVAMSARANTDFIDSTAMRRCLMKSGFSLADLKTDPKGMSLYLCLPQRYMEANYRWLRMITTLAIADMERIPRPPKSGHPVLMVLDEFPALRRMRAVENAAAQIAGFGVKMVFAVQTLAQLKDIYKENWETLVANAGIKLFFGNDDQFTREYASKLVGECEVSRVGHNASTTIGGNKSWSHSTTRGVSFGTSNSSSGGSSGNGGGSNSGMGTSTTSTTSSSTTYGSSSGTSWSETRGQSESVQKRFLITPDEVGRLFGNRDDPAVLVLIAGYQPLHLKRIQYFTDPVMAGMFDRHADHPPPPTLRQIPALHAANTAARRQRRRDAMTARLRGEAERLVAQAREAREILRRRQERIKRLKRERRNRIFVVVIGIWGFVGLLAMI